MVEVNRIIAEKLNRCIKYVFPKYPSGGTLLPNGSWNGGAGLLQRGEADYIGVPSTMNDRRMQVMDYSVYVDMDSQVIVNKRPSLEADIAGFVNPFTAHVWALVSVGLVLVCLATWVLHLAQDSVTGGRWLAEGNSSSSALWTSWQWTVGTALSQSSTWWPSGCALRVLAGTWLLMAFILTVVYRCNLKAMIIIPKIHLPFNSMEELLHTDIKCFVSSGSIIDLMMQNAAPGSQLDRLRKQVVIHLDAQRAIRDIGLGKHAALNNNHIMNYVLDNSFAKAKTCQLYLAKEAFLSGFSDCLALPKGSPLKQPINRILEGLQESGVLRYLYRRAVPYASVCLQAASFTRPNNNLRPLELGDFYGVFSLYTGGMVIASVLFVAEKLSVLLSAS